MTVGSGDGFIVVADGTRRWGRFGAAGVLVRHRCPEDGDFLFLARRSQLTHRGGTWAVPGGAIDRGEEPLAAALREFTEEIGVVIDRYELAHTYEDDHGGWSYWTFVLDVPERFDPPTDTNWETEDVRWVHVSEVGAHELFDAFERTLEVLGLIAPGRGSGEHGRSSG